MLLSQLFIGQVDDPEGLSLVMQAIVNHDKEDLKLVNNISAILILADKSDVHRTRTNDRWPRNLFDDIHGRVNYAATDNSLSVNRRKKEIVLKIDIDAKVSNPMEYFEIFSGRMKMCHQAADYLKHKFVLKINNFQLS